MFTKIYLVNKGKAESIMYKILIVDDEKIERRGIKSLLKKLNIELEIHETSNGQCRQLKKI